MKILVIGAGFSGAVIARELAENNHQVVIIDKRDHLAGNAYDYVNEYGIRVHKYGPHIFHTSNNEVVSWLSKFTEWVPYKHKVKAMLSTGQLVTLPVNSETTQIVGRENIIDTFIRPYTKKMWGLDIEDLDPSILTRVPVRDDLNEFYFPNDSFQALPKNGYEAIFIEMLRHKNIRISLKTEHNAKLEESFDFIFNSMPIDEYFQYEHGQLPYRSIKFNTVTLPLPKVFSVPVINFTHSDPETRVTEWKNFPGHGVNVAKTTLTYEVPCDFKDNNFERYYPVKDLMGANRSLYALYEKKVPRNMKFTGRCGLYAYLDMHQAINASLSLVKKFI
jgi:UDP-galactopyranose mutase